MRPLFLAVILAALVIAAPVTTHAQLGAIEGPKDERIEALQLLKAYAYATSEVQQNGAVFMQIKNNTDADINIAGAASFAAKTVELHTHDMDGDTMMMRQVDSYTVPAGETITLEPSGHHIMLIELNRPLELGKSFPITLSTDSDQNFVVNVSITPPGQSLDDMLDIPLVGPKN